LHFFLLHFSFGSSAHAGWLGGGGEGEGGEGDGGEGLGGGGEGLGGGGDGGDGGALHESQVFSHFCFF